MFKWHPSAEPVAHPSRGAGRDGRGYCPKGGELSQVQPSRSLVYLGLVIESNSLDLKTPVSKELGTCNQHPTDPPPTISFSPRARDASRTAEWDISSTAEGPPVPSSTPVLTSLSSEAWVLRDHSHYFGGSKSRAGMVGNRSDKETSQAHQEPSNQVDNSIGQLDGGLGGLVEGRQIGLRWPPRQSKLHINELELKAGFLAP